MSAEPLCSEIECGQQRDHPNHNSGNPDGHFFHVGKPLLGPNVKREAPPVDEVTGARRVRDPGADPDLVAALKRSLMRAAQRDKSDASVLVGSFLLTAKAPMTTSELSRALSAQEGRYVSPARLNGGLRTLLKHELVICLPRLSRRGQKVTGSVNAWYPSDSLAAWVSRQGVTG